MLGYLTTNSKCQPHGGAGVIVQGSLKLRGYIIWEPWMSCPVKFFSKVKTLSGWSSPKSAGFILWGTWVCVQNCIAFRFAHVGIFQFGPKCMLACHLSLRKTGGRLESVSSCETHLTLTSLYPRKHSRSPFPWQAQVLLLRPLAVTFSGPWMPLWESHSLSLALLSKWNVTRSHELHSSCCSQMRGMSKIAEESFRTAGCRCRCVSLEETYIMCASTNDSSVNIWCGQCGTNGCFIQHAHSLKLHREKNHDWERNVPIFSISPAYTPADLYSVCVHTQPSAWRLLHRFLR